MPATRRTPAWLDIASYLHRDVDDDNGDENRDERCLADVSRAQFTARTQFRTL